MKEIGGRKTEKKRRVEGKIGKRKAKEINQEKENEFMNLNLSSENNFVNN